MEAVSIDIVNRSTCVSDAQIAKFAEAFQTQVSHDFAPIWGIDAKVTFVPHDKTPSPRSWLMAFMDKLEMAGVLGYHETTKAGLPIMKIGAKDDLDSGSSVEATASHEGLEGLADPWINDCIESADGLYFYAKEVSDGPEDDKYGYTIDGVLMSDFVTPEWFNDGPHPASVKFDFLGHCTHPLHVLHGGYISRLSLGDLQAGWQDVTSDGQDVSARKKPGSRYERRKRHWAEQHPSQQALMARLYARRTELLG